MWRVPMENKNNKDNDLNLNIILEKLSGLTDTEFLNLGSGGLSYIKSAGHRDNHELFALHGADGSHIATGQDVETLHVIAKQHDLLPMTIQ